MPLKGQFFSNFPKMLNSAACKVTKFHCDSQTIRSGKRQKTGGGEICPSGVKRLTRSTLGNSLGGKNIKIAISGICRFQISFTRRTQIRGQTWPASWQNPWGQVKSQIEVNERRFVFHGLCGTQIVLLGIFKELSLNPESKKWPKRKHCFEFYRLAFNVSNLCVKQPFAYVNSRKMNPLNPIFGGR